MKKFTTECFIEKAKEVHGNRFDYSKCIYDGAEKKVIITCRVHGDFFQRPFAHLKGQGCKKCTRGVLGIGILDLDGEDFSLKSYMKWSQIIHRCFDNKYKTLHPTYKDATVSDEWLYYSNFKDWFYNPDNGYIDGYHLDKDLLIKHNKLYSAETCCFLPQELNKVLTRRDRDRGSLPIGVHKLSRKNAYRAHITMNGKTHFFGYFHDPLSAFEEYKKRKEQYIKDLADEYFGNQKITQRVYDAMIRYEVDVDD